jgi:hypothetical protein
VRSTYDDRAGDRKVPAGYDTFPRNRTILDMPTIVRVEVGSLIAAQHDMGVCDAVYADVPRSADEKRRLPRSPFAGFPELPGRKPPAMSPAHVRKVAGTESSPPGAAHTEAATVAQAPVPGFPAPPAGHYDRMPARGTPDHALAVQDQLAAWVCDLSLLHELTERLARTAVLDDALREVLQAGATLVGARRGMITLCPGDGLGPDATVGLGLTRSDLGALETVPARELAAPQEARAAQAAQAADALDAAETAGTAGTAAQTANAPGAASAAGPASTPGATSAAGAAQAAQSVEVLHRDLRAEPDLAPRHREVAAQLGFAASYELPLTAERAGPLGSAVWFYDEPAEPAGRRRRLAGHYLRFAAEHVARCLDLDRARGAAAALAAELLPARLPRVPGVRMAVRHDTGPRGGGDWYDALPLPEGALGLAVGGVTGAGPGAVAAMGRLRASLRAYAVMEGEDPVAVLSDLELLLRLTEPARSATALFGYVTTVPGGHRLILAGAGHCPPLVVGDRRCEYVETSLSAPLNMLSCWEAPSVELSARPGESLLLFTDGLLHRTGEPADRAFARLHSLAQGASRTVRADPERLADHVLHGMVPDGLDRTGGAEDLVLLVARFD